MQPTIQAYNDTIEDILKFKFKSPSKKKIFPIIIDPRISLPDSFPDISEVVKKLGSNPYGSTENEDELIIHFPGGDVSYSLLREYGYYIPSGITTFGVQTEWSRQALRTERFNTVVLIYPLDNDESPEEGDNLYTYVIGDDKKDIRLKIEILEGENKVPHDWWISDKFEKIG